MTLDPLDEILEVYVDPHAPPGFTPPATRVLLDVIERQKNEAVRNANAYAMQVRELAGKVAELERLWDHPGGIETIEEERDAYRRYTGAVLHNMFLLRSDGAERALAILHGMLEQYLVAADDPFIPEARKPGDYAYRFTVLGMAALDTMPA